MTSIPILLGHYKQLPVGVPVPGVDAAVLVVELYGAGDGLGEREATGGRLDGRQLVPDILNTQARTY